MSRTINFDEFLDEEVDYGHREVEIDKGNHTDFYPKIIVTTKFTNFQKQKKTFKFCKIN